MSEIENRFSSCNEEIQELKLRQTCLEDRLEDQSKENEDLRIQLQLAQDELKASASKGRTKQRLPRELTVSPNHYTNNS